MKMPMRFAGVCLWLAVLYGAATPVAAQGRNLDVGLGYQFLRLGGVSFPEGLSVEVTQGVADAFAVVGETGWSRKSTTPFGFSERTTALHFGGGMRWAARNDQRVRPFAQFVLGVERDIVAVKEFGSESASSLLVQPGGGMTVHLTGRQIIFGQIDLRRVFQEGAGVTVMRTTVGWQVRLN
jgi:hypothetical protein